MILTRLIAAVARRPGEARSNGRVRELVRAAEEMKSSGDTAGAEKALREALGIDAAAPGIHERLALLLTGEARFEEALAHFRAGYAAGGLSVGALGDFVRVLIDRSEPVEAAQIGEAAA